MCHFYFDSVLPPVLYFFHSLTPVAYFSKSPQTHSLRPLLRLAFLYTGIGWWKGNFSHGFIRFCSSSGKLIASEQPCLYIGK